tara:strand:- start:5149 stop:5367 length:219 start_codon:yes stop_codon:yes gene_type:complete
MFNSAVVDVQPSRIATSVDVNRAKAAAAPDWQLDKAVRSASKGCLLSNCVCTLDVASNLFNWVVVTVAPSRI